MDVETIVKEFIKKSFIFSKEANEILSNTPLLDSGLIDSTGIFELVAFIETQFNIEVFDEEIVPENFETLNGIALFIDKKSKSMAG